jgi:GT2 family glycosyltransferase
MAMPKFATVTAVVVTYNRLELLEQCLARLQAQSMPPHSVLVVDNASTDGTESYFAVRRAPGLHYLRLGENFGGAGGFANGLRAAVEAGADWVWMMDDDAEPHPTALEELMRVATDPGNIYGSVATKGTSTSWATTLLGPPLSVVDKTSAIPPCAAVQSLPFLGFLVHRSIVGKIGLPDAGYFIAADDVEYCLRAQRAGVILYIAGRSRIEHPKSSARSLRFMGRTVVYLKLPPWKRYYDTRNRILNARRYARLRLFFHVLPGTLLRFAAAMYTEPNKRAQARAFIAGTIDGLLGRKGKRHETWGIVS